MSDAQAGTPAITPENSNAGQGSGVADGSGLNAQQQKEYMTLKQKAEEFNKVKAERDTLEQRLAQMEAFVSRGAGQATDPTAELVNQLREQAQYDPVAKGTLMNMEMTAKAQAEAWLAGQLVSVPDAKRERVAAIIRNAGYQIGASQALEMVTDPDTKTLAERLQEAESEIARLKNAKPNGSSPASAVPSTASADETGTQTEMKRSEYVATLKRGGQAALDLMKAAGENRVRIVRD
jgi:hypothetical protein